MGRRRAAKRGGRPQHYTGSLSGAVLIGFGQVVRQVRPVPHAQFPSDPFEPHRRPAMIATVHHLANGSGIFEAQGVRHELPHDASH